MSAECKGGGKTLSFWYKVSTVAHMIYDARCCVLECFWSVAECSNYV